MPTGKKGPGGPAACLGRNCEWEAGPAGLTCIDGGGGCHHAHFCDAEESGFHDLHLVEATKKLNRIISRIPADAKGRKLAFCETNMGTLLAWVKDDDGKPRKGRKVTPNDDDATVTKALKLKVASASKKR